MFKRKISAEVRRRSVGRAVMLVGVVVAAALWVVPGLSGAARILDEKLRDRLTLMLEPAEEREDLVFVGIDAGWMDEAGVSAAEVRESRALSLMSRGNGNLQFDRLVCAELIEKLVDAGAKLIIFDILFIGSSGDPEVDREFAEVLTRHHDKVVLSMMFHPEGDGSYNLLSSVRQLPMLSKDPKQWPHEGYVNLWPDE